MTLISEHIESDTRERILEVALRLFREIGYQKTTVADIAKVLRMSPANVYRFFDSKKAIHEGVARSLMGEVEDAAQAIATKPGLAAGRLRELMTTIHRMNSERYVGNSKLHEMVEIAMEESWDVCVVLPSADDCAMRPQAGAVDRPDDRLCHRRPVAAW